MKTQYEQINKFHKILFVISANSSNIHRNDITFY